MRRFPKLGTSSTLYLETCQRDQYRIYIGRGRTFRYKERFCHLFVCLPDKNRGVQQAYDGRDVDAHQHLVVNVLQAKIAVLHLTVGHIIMED